MVCICLQRRGKLDFLHFFKTTRKQLLPVQIFPPLCSGVAMQLLGCLFIGGCWWVMDQFNTLLLDCWNHQLSVSNSTSDGWLVMLQRVIQNQSIRNHWLTFTVFYLRHLILNTFHLTFWILNITHFKKYLFYIFCIYDILLILTILLNFVILKHTQLFLYNVCYFYKHFTQPYRPI